MGDCLMESYSLRRLVAALATALVVLALGCARHDVTPIEDVVREQEAAASDEPAYSLRPGDVLRIDFAADDALDTETPITPSGTITLPMAGEIPAAGMTVGDLALRVADLLSPYLQDPTVSILVKNLQRRFVFVLGEVKRPGRLETWGGTTITAALADAGGFEPSGKASSVMVVRTTGVEEPIAFKVDVTKILSARDMSQDVLLRDNDVVYVPTSVIGQVDQFVDLFFTRIAPFQLAYLRGYDMAHLKDASWRF
jgi:protein involved in polysaccharide export with SLBB domain